MFWTFLKDMCTYISFIDIYYASWMTSDFSKRYYVYISSIDIYIIYRYIYHASWMTHASHAFRYLSRKVKLNNKIFCYVCHRLE